MAEVRKGRSTFKRSLFISVFVTTEKDVISLRKKKISTLEVFVLHNITDISEITGYAWNTLVFSQIFDHCHSWLVWSQLFNLVVGYIANMLWGQNQDFM